MRNVKSQVWSQFLCGVLAEVATRNEFIRKRGELNEQQSIRTSPLEVLLSCLTLSFRTHRDHSGPGVSHVGYCTILLPNSTFTARLAGNEKKWNPVNILFSVCVCVCVVSFYSCLFSVFCHTERFFKKNRVRTCHCLTARLLFALLLHVSFFPLPPFALLPAPFICALVTSSSCAIEQVKLCPCNNNKENTPLHTNIDPALLFSDWTV